MVRVLVLVILLALLSLGASYVADLDGYIAIEQSSLLEENKRISLSFALFMFALLTLLSAIFLMALVYLLSLPKRFRGMGERRRYRKGLDEVKKSIMAIGAGDSANAFRYARYAKRYLREDSLPMLLTAQAAQISGERNKAHEQFQQMVLLPQNEGRLVGLRGLYVEAKRDGKYDEAEYFVKEALQLAPDSAWAMEAILEIYCHQRNWRGAEKILDRRVLLGQVDRTKGKRYRAVLMAADARSLLDNAPDEALKIALGALKLAPNLVPAAVVAGKILARSGHYHKAAKIVEKTWMLHPHPELASIYINMRPGDSAVDRCTRAKYLAEKGKYPFEGRLALAKAHIDAREYPEARAVLTPLLTEIPTVNVCLLMAAIEHSELGAEGAARSWIAKAAHAPRDPVWIADGIISEEWEPVSPVTGQMDAFVWKAPPDVLGSPLLQLNDPVLGDLDDQPKVLPVEYTQVEDQNDTNAVPDEEVAEKASETDHAPVSGSETQEAVAVSSVNSQEREEEQISTEIEKSVPQTATDEPDQGEESVPDSNYNPEASELSTVTKNEMVMSEKVDDEEDTHSSSEASETAEISDDDASTELTDEKPVEKPDEDDVTLTPSTEIDEVLPFNRLPDDPGPEGDVFVNETETKKKWFGLF